VNSSLGVFVGYSPTNTPKFIPSLGMKRSNAFTLGKLTSNSKFEEKNSESLKTKMSTGNIGGGKR
jgi:hypothetical protein